MAYHEPSFLDGLAAGLAATAGTSMGVFRKRYTTGTDRFIRIPEGQFDTFVGKFMITTPFPVTIVIEYGQGYALQHVFRRVGASDEQQTVYHVAQIPAAVPLTDYHYNMYFYERDDMARLIRFDTYFMAFPYYHPSSGREYLYPGSPELVRDWMTRTYR